jgi:hypothetical protein
MPPLQKITIMQRKRKKNWYIAVLVVSSEIRRAKKYTPLIDLQFRIINSDNPEEAYRAAMRIGKSEEHSYKNSRGETVRWRFRGLNDLRSLDISRLASNTEVYNTLVRSKASKMVVPKKKLTVFWFEANKHRKSSAILA